MGSVVVIQDRAQEEEGLTQFGDGNHSVQLGQQST